MTVLVGSVNGHRKISADACALLMGVPSDQVLVKVACDDPFPKEWLAAWHRRSAEARAATGSDGILEVLDYWAQKDHGRSIVVLGDEAIL